MGNEGLKCLRKMVAENSKYIEDEYRNYNLRILLIGSTGSGKSSIINTINAAVTGRYAVVAVVAQSLKGQVTASYKEYTISNDDRNQEWRLCFKLCDIRGFGSREHGVSKETISRAIRGLIPPGSEIRPREQRGSSPEQDCPEQDHHVDIVLVVLDGTVVSSTQQLSEIKEAIHFAHERDIPVSAVVTKCDKVDVGVSKDAENLYYSEKVHRVVEEAVKQLGISENRIFPIVNYSVQQSVSPPMAIQGLIPVYYLMEDLLQRLKQMKG